MKFTFIGTGTSQGVPVIACNCSCCLSSNPKDKRLRTAMLVESNSTSIVIDTGPDFRQQMLTNKVTRLDAAIFTHQHKDHIAGLDDVRAYNYVQKKDFEVYATKPVQTQLKQEFHYAFSEKKYPGVPNIELIEIKKNTPFSIKDIKIKPLPVLHYKLEVTGFMFDKLVYITDANFLPKETIDAIKNCEVLVLNALRIEKHISHFNLEEAIEMVKIINPKKAYFTHISHLLGKHDTISKQLPENICLGYDGLVLEL